MFREKFNEVKSSERLRREQLIAELAEICIYDENNRERRKRLESELRRMETLRQASQMANTVWVETMI
jgi:hypothetical protein